MKYRAKFDASHAPITKALRRLGLPFVDVARHAGFGCDIIVRHRDGFPVLIEIKKPGAPSTQKLTSSEKALKAMFPQFFRVCVDLPQVLLAMGISPI